MRRTLAAVALCALAFITTGATDNYVAGCSAECVERVKARVVRAAEREEWARYRANPMPFCTWGPESSWDPATGASFHGRPWARNRYRVVNPSSLAGGKFQVIPSTWRAMGGTRYATMAHLARPLHQERIGRVVLRRQGLAAWVGC